MSATERKQCTGCGENKPLSEFDRDARKSDGLRSRCKSCRTVELRKWRQANPEKANAATAKWHKENAEKASASVSRWRAEHPDSVKAFSSRWRAKHPEQALAITARWRAENPQAAHAHDVLNRAVRTGKVVNPCVCEACSNTGRAEAHHDDYSKPLSVRWLCHRCHRDHHREAGAA